MPNTQSQDNSLLAINHELEKLNRKINAQELEKVEASYQAVAERKVIEEETCSYQENIATVVDISSSLINKSPIGHNQRIIISYDDFHNDVDFNFDGMGATSYIISLVVSPIIKFDIKVL